MRAVFVLVMSSLALAGCSGLYNSPGVLAGETAAGEVSIVEISAGTLATANASPYRPRTLPAIFAASAGTAGSSRGLGALPDPSFSPESRPGPVPTRLPPAYTPGSYQIGVGDVVLLATPKTGNTVEALSGLLAAESSRQGYTVQDDGAITIPDVGRVRVAGLTLDAAENAVFQALVAKNIDPTFSLEVTEFNSQHVTVGGAVKNPAAIALALNPVTLAEALTAAGGVTAADRTTASIRIYRDGQLYQMPLDAYLSAPAMQKIALKDGDSIFVDTAYDLDNAQGYFSQQIQLASLRQSARTAALSQLDTEIGIRRGELNERRKNFLDRVDLDAVERDYVYIAGEVGLQNRFTLPFERTASLADALFDRSRGVPNETGNISELYVLRGAADGRNVTAWHLNAVNAANLVLATRFELRPNDVVFVAEQPVTALDRLISQLAPSLTVARSVLP